MCARARARVAVSLPLCLSTSLSLYVFVLHVYWPEQVLTHFDVFHRGTHGPVDDQPHRLMLKLWYSCPVSRLSVSLSVCVFLPVSLFLRLCVSVCVSAHSVAVCVALASANLVKNVSFCLLHFTFTLSKMAGTFDAKTTSTVRAGIINRSRTRTLHKCSASHARLLRMWRVRA